NSPSTTLRRCSKESALAIELTPAEALATSATSSGSAPMKRANRLRATSYCSTHISHGDPCSCQLRRYWRNPASTRSDNAPWEQLLRNIFFLRTGNWDRIAAAVVLVKIASHFEVWGARIITRPGASVVSRSTTPHR